MSLNVGRLDSQKCSRFRCPRRENGSLTTLVAVQKGKGGNYPPFLSPGPVNERRWESLFHHQSRPFDRILAVQLINVLHRAARRPVTKLKEPHKWPSPGDKPLHRITYWFYERSKKSYHIKPLPSTKVATSVHESAFKRVASTFKCADAGPEPNRI